MTIAGAVSFGFFGVKNILSIHEQAAKVEDVGESVESQAAKVEDIQKSVQESLESVVQMEQDMKSHSENIQASSAKTMNRLRATENSLKRKVASLEHDFNSAISRLQEQSENEAKNLDDRLQKGLEQAEKEIAKVQKSLENISGIFNIVSVEHKAILNARERLLLTLLALKIDPDRPDFNFNYARWSAKFGRFDEALKHFSLVLNSKDISPDRIEKTKRFIKQCEEAKAKPPDVRYTDPKGVAIGDFVIMQLHVNTVETLWKNGYLTYEQVQQIFEKAKIKK